MSGSEMNDNQRGPLAWMAKNSVAANLMMFVILIGGALGVLRIKQEVFPEFDLDIIQVAVPYPGASPEEVEQGIVLAVEEAVRGLDGVKRVTSSSAEGAGAVSVELLLDAEPDKVLADVKAEVDRIASFPEEAEEPTVQLAGGKQKVITLVVSGDQDVRTLHAIAESARVDLLMSPEVTQVEIEGVPDLEISVEVPRETLESLGLTLDDVAAQLAASSIELPGGGVDTRAGELLVRVSDRRLDGAAFEDVILRSTRGGASVRLGDVATVTDGYADTDQASYYNGEPAVRVVAYRVGSETPTSVADAVKAYVEEMKTGLPPTVSVDVWDDDSEILKDRISLLVRNARSGLILVLLVLALFLNLRLAFWVALGIPISFMGAFLLMPAWGLSINMITLFALIVTLGMVVDDAIVVGESAFSKTQEGVPPMKAAIEGAREMALPVTFAILTTIAAFSPMFFVPGVMGKIFRLFPAVVISVLLFSLIESFFVLPAHLSHGGGERRGRVGRAIGAFTDLFERPRSAVSGWLTRFTRERYSPFLARVVEWRYAAVATAVAMFIFSVGLVASGTVPFNFFPKLEGDQVTASARLPYGAPLENTEAVRAQIEAAAFAAIDQSGGDAIFEGMLSKVGEAGASGGPVGGAGETGSHLVTVEIALVPSGDRDFTSADFRARWLEAMPEMAGLESLTVSSASGPGAGAAVDLQLSHADTTVLAAASSEIAATLATFPDLTGVENQYAAGKPQLDFHLLPNAKTLGLTSQMVARQLRSAFYGAEAIREQRGRNELKVMARLPADQRRSEYDLEQLQIRTPSGAFVPLYSVAAFDRGQAPTTIYRDAGRRKVNVSAELSPGVPSPQEVNASLKGEVLPALKAKYPGLDVEFAGSQREQAEAFAALGQNYIMALFIIFALLAIPFKSYTQPLIIMSAIPFGFIGAVGGHLIMRYELSLISMFGIIALSGVVVNDSLVLIDAANRYRREGASPYEAITRAGARRLRPILLTSLTTFFGLAPMITETSVQARFLIPMAISLGFGVLFATVIILLVIPALYMILEDAHGLVARRSRPAHRDDGEPTLPEPALPEPAK